MTEPVTEPTTGPRAVHPAPAVQPDTEDDPDAEVRVDPRDWPVFDQHTPRIGQARSRIAAMLFVLFLLPSALQALHAGRPPVLVVLATAVYGLAYLLVWGPVLHWPPRARIAWVVLLYASGSACIVAVGPDAGSLSMLGYALASAILLLPLFWARLLGYATITVGLAVYWVIEHRTVWTEVLVLGLIISTLLGMNQMSRTVAKLNAARSEIRTLAVQGERARMARDLHDVLGHSLTTITVKTALARRLVESGADPERVRAELRDTEELSRRTLGDIRATVSGQRRASLAGELASARAVLRAAGIEADLPQAVDGVDPGAREPLAYALREGVTNVVRHSGAGRCTVRLGPGWVEVRDDGAGPRDGDAVPGNGLTGLRERLATVHGTVTAGPGPRGGFRLRAEVPRGTSAEASR
jgi:two-component system, NarL family, sensor histidine kinase DesK